MNDAFNRPLDWGHALFDSLLWVGGLVHRGSVHLAVLFVTARFTTWGSQFWCGSPGPITGRTASVRGSLVAMLLSVIIDVRAGGAVHYQSRDPTTPAGDRLRPGHRAREHQGRRIHGFWISLLVFAILAAILVTRVMVDLFILQRFSAGGGLADRPADRRPVRRPGVLPRPDSSTRGIDNPGSTHPVRYRRVHRAVGPAAEHPRTKPAAGHRRSGPGRSPVVSFAGIPDTVR